MIEVEVLTRAELVRRLGSVRRFRDAVEDGAWARVLYDAYVAEADLALPITDLRASALRSVLPVGAVLSHWAGLWVLGLDVLPRDRDGLDVLDVTARRGHRLAARPGVRPHSASVTDDDLVEVGDLVVVSAARAVVDVTRSFGLVEGVAAGDAALRAGATSSERILDVVDRSARLRSVVTARELEQHLDGRSESLMESRLRMGYVLEGGIRMQTQVDLYDADGHHRGRADLYLDGVVVEYDGRAERLQKARFAGDRVRHGDLADLGLEIRRVTSVDYYRRTPAYRLAVLLRALAKARARVDGTWCFGPDTLRAPRLRPLPTRAELLRRAAA